MNYAFGIVTLCADSEYVDKRQVGPASQSVCHELVHALQLYPCNLKGPKQWEGTTCIETLKLEFQAARCAGQCALEGGGIDYSKCAQKAAASSRSYPGCKAKTDAEFTELFSGEFMEWVKPAVKSQSQPLGERRELRWEFDSRGVFSDGR